VSGMPSQREIDAYYAQHQPCPCCGRTWSSNDDGSATIVHRDDCEFIAMMNQEPDDEIAVD